MNFMVGAMYAGDSAPAVPGPVVPSAFALSRTASLASANAGTVASTAPAPAPRRAARLASADKDKSGKTKQKLLSALGFNSNATRRPAISQPLPPTASAAASAVQEKERQQNMDRIRHAAQTLKLGGQQIVRRLRKKLSSKTPKEELPKTWEEYSKRYVNGEMDLNDPPVPPAELASGEPSPYQQRVFMPPMPSNEVERQNVVNRLDLFGTRARNARAESDAASLASRGDAETISISRESMVSTVNRDQAVASLKAHPVFRDLVSKCRELFDSKVGMLTVLDDEEQLFLVTGGMDLGDSLPRSVTFCAHALMDEDNDGMVVLDARDDWRFANGMPATHLGARFYAGVPLLAPTFGDPSAPAIPIGTLCVCDDKPREAFSQEQRQILHDLAAEATKEVERWVNARMAGKLSRLEYNFQSSSTTLPLQAAQEVPEEEEDAQTVDEQERPESADKARDEATQTKPASSAFVQVPASAITTPEPRALPERRGSTTSSVASGPSGPAPSFALPLPPTATSSLPMTPPDSLYGAKKRATHARDYSDASAASISSAAMSVTASNSSSVRSSVVSDVSVASPQVHVRREHQRRPSTALSLQLAVTNDAPVTAVPKEAQRVFDQAVKLLAQALDMSLVYLAAIDLAPSSSNGGKVEPVLRLLAAHGLPDPAPAFDPSLHIKALRAPEGGLLYRNPRPEQSQSQTGSAGYASGILIPVLEVRRTGYVLSGYTVDPARAFAQRDLAKMVKLAETLELWCTKLGRSTSA